MSATTTRGSIKEVVAPMVVTRTIAPPTCSVGMTSVMITKTHVKTPPTPKTAIYDVK